jgi:hypothetical protein
LWEKSRWGTCRGIYLSRDPYQQHQGTRFVTLEVAARVSLTVRVEGVLDIPEVVGLPRFEDRPDEVRERLLARGYDSVYVANAATVTRRANAYLSVLRNRDVRVVAQVGRGSAARATWADDVPQGGYRSAAASLRLFARAAR